MKQIRQHEGSNREMHFRKEELAINMNLCITQLNIFIKNTGLKKEELLCCNF